ncbi:MraY family glycosyltransferase [Paenibacillus protaetiae]|uniref:Undecaprenyl/decaprenyl-phosphate alpha-N-acetylglucosaminyl 1-phosphate transferase n=1 Tax=Paenibacillus protaetiae TaxID=2509456 RepID=A0A4P6EWE0_9BACL|nr:MraY family glycosyltransferase [Paenibacillus protaetiae]QAY67344.1 undecaprenyl/decaprenyl-phosphate alpha-N-acetylglucosaminyl 1-phosphate transferase [Paenibacillus protaetiae]
MIYWLAAICSLVLSVLFVPLFRSLALKLGFVDQPNKRKIHRKPIPLMGGTAIYLSCCIAIVSFLGLEPLSITILIGGGVLVIIGLMDDAFKSKGRDFPVWPRVIFYAAVAAFPLIYDIQIMGIRNPASGIYISFPEWVSAIATFFWIFALINMINFIDGVDGLASGVCTLAAFTLLIAALVKGQNDTALVAASLGGASIGFLAYNFYPARIFMGDAGATFLGYTLAVVAVDGAFKKATFVTVLVPLLALGLPIMDTAIVMIRRLIAGKGLHVADKMHTHHTLMRWGLNQVQTVSFLYLIAALFSLLSILLLLTTG